MTTSLNNSFYTRTLNVVSYVARQTVSNFQIWQLENAASDVLYKTYVCVTDNAANYFQLFPCGIFFESLDTLRSTYEIRYVWLGCGILRLYRYKIYRKNL
jgi:hypothetical protein